MRLILPTKYSYDHYTILNTDGLLILDYWDSITGYRKQNIWAKCILRKPMICRLSGETMAVGTEAYRPVTNGLNRGHRMKAEELEKFSC